MDLDTTTMRLLAAIEREQDEAICLAEEAVMGTSPMTSDGSLYGPPADLATTCD